MNVTVYTKPNCPNCEKTKRDMDILGIEYDVVDITVDTRSGNLLVVLGYKSLPIVRAAGTSWQGYDQEKIKALVNYAN